uniref:Uncharacterized protein n=1 Tax=Oryza meridionalis TaxID=40149 RepID=A0A0E0EJU4_9ORYZ
MIEEEKPVKESDGLEDLWKDFSLAAECTKLDTNEDMSNEKDVDDENEMDDDCNHDIRIHEDLGHTTNFGNCFFIKKLQVNYLHETPHVPYSVNF